MSSYTYLVVGAAGFIGRRVVKTMLNEGLKVRGLDLFLPKEISKEVEWIIGSAQDEVLFANAAHGCSRVIYLAGGGLPASGNSNMSAEINQHVKTVVKSAEICRDIGVKSFIFASSGGTVYGSSSELPISEKSITQPLNAYGASKVAIEHYLRIIGSISQMRTVSLRISNPYGEGQHANKSQGFIAAAMAAATNEQTLEIWGDGSVIRDFVYVDDVADAFLSACSYEGNSGIFNIGSGKGISISSLVKQIEKACNCRIKVNFTPGRGIDVKSNILDITRASNVLGWAPCVNLEQGLQKTAAWWIEKNYN